ncbi:MAG: HD domain-containing protein [Acidobacteriota bacterium]
MRRAVPAAILSREQLQAAEESRLSACALRSSEATRARPIDPEGRAFDLRTEFQRDRDRIVHSRAFRRLRQKGHVSFPSPDDHLRNRLIHTLEVAGVARTVARSLSLNEDLAEAIALGHDLGHCPFGRHGEAVLDGILTGAVQVEGLDPEKAVCRTGLRRSDQSLRVVDLLEKRYRHPGLNLTDAVREGILKQAGAGCTAHDPELDLERLLPEAPPFLEAQIVALAGELTQQVHDLDDGIHEGAVLLGEAERLAIVRELAAKMGSSYAVPGRHVRIHQINRGVMHLLVTSLVTYSGAALRRWMDARRIATHEDFLRHREQIPPELLSLAPPVRELFGELQVFISRRITNSRSASRLALRARRLLVGLFRAYHDRPLLLDDHVLLRFKERTGLPFLRDVSPSRVPGDVAAHYRNNPVFIRVVADHLAGMTESYALAEGERLQLSPQGR